MSTPESRPLCLPGSGKAHHFRIPAVTPGTQEAMLGTCVLLFTCLDSRPLKGAPFSRLRGPHTHPRAARCAISLVIGGRIHYLVKEQK
jgi:hypothetical protein